MALVCQPIQIIMPLQSALQLKQWGTLSWGSQLCHHLLSSKTARMSCSLFLKWRETVELLLYAIPSSRHYWLASEGFRHQGACYWHLFLLFHEATQSLARSTEIEQVATWCYMNAWVVKRAHGEVTWVWMYFSRAESRVVPTRSLRVGSAFSELHSRSHWNKRVLTLEKIL